MNGIVPVKSFTHLTDVSPVALRHDHGGVGEIHFRRLWTEQDFQAPIDFVDFTVIPPQSTIGRHAHRGNEEAYFVASGSPLVRIDDDVRRLSRGDIAVVRSGQSHELINDTPNDVEILVIQVRVGGS